LQFGETEEEKKEEAWKNNGGRRRRRRKGAFDIVVLWGELHREKKLE
jgi:hypothetical protein